MREQRKFIKKGIIFGFCTIIIIFSFFWISAQTGYNMYIAEITDSEIWGSLNNGLDIIEKIEKSREYNDYNCLILGDSVCNQIYGSLQEKNADYLILASNRALTMAGQFILVQNFIETHPEVKEIDLIIIPESLTATFDTVYGYQYTAIPFVLTEEISELNTETIGLMNETYGSFFMQPYIVQTISNSPMLRKVYINTLYRLNPIESSGAGLSQISVEYLRQIDELCSENDIDFNIISGPIADTSEHRIMLENLEEEIRREGLEELFSDYFCNIIFFPEEYFVDGIHFCDEYDNSEFYNEVIHLLRQNTGCMELLKL